MGYSMRTEGYRYTEWRIIETGEVLARELYDHQNDAEENINVVEQPEKQSVVPELAALLRGGYRMALPAVRP